MQAFEAQTALLDVLCHGSRQPTTSSASARGKKIGFGGSMTLDGLGVYEQLKDQADDVAHWKGGDQLPKETCS